MTCTAGMYFKPVLQTCTSGMYFRHVPQACTSLSVRYKLSRVGFVLMVPLLVLAVSFHGWVQLQRSCVSDPCNTLLLLFFACTSASRTSDMYLRHVLQPPALQTCTSGMYFSLTFSHLDEVLRCPVSLVIRQHAHLSWPPNMYLWHVLQAHIVEFYKTF
jgi:hypothetical protein